MRLSEADHARVTASVAAAEARTDAEIVTVVAQASDAYRDVGLRYAVLAMLMVPGGIAFAPGVADRVARWHAGGWDGASLPTLLLVTAVAQAAVFLAVRYALAWRPLLMRMTPRRTKVRRVRQRAIDLFRAGAEQRTAARVGVLLYLSMAEHDAEIVADAGIVDRVAAERWGDAMELLIERVRTGDVAGGMAAAVDAIGTVLAEHFPKTKRDANELPDRLIEL